MYLQRKQKYKQKRYDIHEVHMSMKICITLDKKIMVVKDREHL